MERSKTSTSQEEDDYIDMEVSPSSNIYCPSESSPPHSGEFEFQVSSTSQEKETITPSPADELFYQGKLLPFHLPPRLQLVQKLLLQNHKTTKDTRQGAFDEEQQCSSAHFISTASFTAPPTNSSTPLDQSCNISPSESCRVSCELNPDEYFSQWSTEMAGFSFIGGANHPKKSWSKKFRLIKQPSLTQKLKASRTYLKSFFTKSSACSSDESSAKAAGVNHAEAAANASKAKENLNKYIKVGKKNPFGHFDKQLVDEDSLTTTHRRSFSDAIKRHCATKCLSSTSSSNSSSSSSSSSFSLKSNYGFYELNFLKRSSSVSETENAIEGAIAHCKKSQRQHDSVKTETEVGSCLLSASRIANHGGKDRQELCRI